MLYVAVCMISNVKTAEPKTSAENIGRQKGYFTISVFDYALYKTTVHYL